MHPRQKKQATQVPLETVTRGRTYRVGNGDQASCEACRKPTRTKMVAFDGKQKVAGIDNPVHNRPRCFKKVVSDLEISRIANAVNSHSNIADHHRHEAMVNPPQAFA